MHITNQISKVTEVQWFTPKFSKKGMFNSIDATGEKKMMRVGLYRLWRINGNYNT